MAAVTPSFTYRFPEDSREWGLGPRSTKFLEESLPLLPGHWIAVRKTIRSPKGNWLILDPKDPFCRIMKRPTTVDEFARKILDRLPPQRGIFVDRPTGIEVEIAESIVSLWNEPYIEGQVVRAHALHLVPRRNSGR